MGDYIKHFCLDRDLFLEKERVGQLRKEASKFPTNSVEHVRKQLSDLDSYANSIVQTGDLSQKRQDVFEFKNQIDHLDIEVKLLKQKTRLHKWLQKFSDLPKNNEESKNLIERIDLMEKYSSWRSLSIDKKEEFIAEYTKYVNQLDILIIDAPVEKPSTNDSRANKKRLGLLLKELILESTFLSLR